MNRRLSASFEKGGFDALSAEAGAESATSRPLSNSYWLDKWNDFKLANWLDILEFPETTLKSTQQLLKDALQLL